METINFGEENNLSQQGGNPAPKAPDNRKKKLIWAGVILAALILSVIGWQYELAKQKVDANSSNKLQNTLIGFITSLFTNPGDKSSQPAMTITSGPGTGTQSGTQAPVKTITQTQTKTKTPTQPKPIPPAVKQPLSTPVVQATSTPPTPTPTPTPIPALTPTTTPASVVTYSNSSVQTFSAGDLVINEIMYDLAKSDCVSNGTDDDHEWVELYNNSSQTITLTGGMSGWKFNDGSSNRVLNEPPTKGSRGSLSIAPGGYVILAASSTAFLVDYPNFNGTVITVAMSLNNTTAAISIIAPDKTKIDEIVYQSDWGAKHNCKTLSRKSAAGDSNNSANWAESLTTGGTPGAANNL